MNWGKALQEQLEASTRYTMQNFGMPVGPEYTEMVRSVLANDKAALRLGLDYVLSLLELSKINRERMGLKLENMVRNIPAAYMGPTTWMHC